MKILLFMSLIVFAGTTEEQVLKEISDQFSITPELEVTEIKSGRNKIFFKKIYKCGRKLLSRNYEKNKNFVKDLFKKTRESKGKHSRKEILLPILQSCRDYKKVYKELGSPESHNSAYRNFVDPETELIHKINMRNSAKKMDCTRVRLKAFAAGIIGGNGALALGYCSDFKGKRWLVLFTELGVSAGIGGYVRGDFGRHIEVDRSMFDTKNEDLEGIEEFTVILRAGTNYLTKGNIYYLQCGAAYSSSQHTVEMRTKIPLKRNWSVLFKFLKW